MKVAIVHDWLVAKAGSESCLEHFIQMFPQADLFSVVDFLPEESRGFLGGRRPKTTFIQKLPGARKRFRSYLPLMPIAIEQLDMTSYDLVISSSFAVANGVITGPHQTHISYTHSPIRYAWDLQHVYLAQSGLARGIKSVIARLILHYMRIWDNRTANGVDHYIANSRFVARRIKKFYGREAHVIYPPVDTARFALGKSKEDFYLTASRMVPYKLIPLIAEAFASMPDRRLVIIGDGPEMRAVQKAAGPNVEILGHQSDEQIVAYMQKAKGFVFAAEEDFGIAPVEAQACGTPVIAYGRGGSLETILGRDAAGQTGVFFYEQTPAAIIAAIEHFETRLPFIDPQDCRARAKQFNVARFRAEIRAFIDDALVKSQEYGNTFSVSDI